MTDFPLEFTTVLRSVLYNCSPFPLTVHFDTFIDVQGNLSTQVSMLIT